MANNDATVIVGKLSDEELQKSINKLVSNVEAASKKMADAFDSNIQRMKQSLASLGSVNVNMSGATDGGSVRRTSNLKKEEEQGKAVAATYDNINKAIKTARQSASMWIQRDIDNLRSRNQELIYAINRYKNIEIKPVVKDDGSFKQAIDDIQRRINDARRQLQEVPPTSPLGKQFSQELQNARHEYTELLRSKKAFDEQSKEPLRLEELRKNRNEIWKLTQEMSSAANSEKKLESTMVSGANSITKFGESADKAYKDMLRLSYSRAMKIPTDEYDLAYAKLERLQAILADTRMRGVLTPQQTAATENEIKRLEVVLQDMVTSQQKLTGSSERYTEEIRKQAQAIRESEEWKKKGEYYIMLDKETNTFTTIEAKDRRSIEEQLLAIYEVESRTKKDMVQTEQQLNTQTKKEVSTEERLSQLEKERLGIAEKITAESKKRIEPKTFASYDTLRESMAHVLGLQQSQVKLADTETSSYLQLNNTLKQLRQTYERLSATERKSEQGKVLIASMHEIEDAIRRVRQQASRPVNLQSALGLSERTIDDIAYKMQRLASYRSGLDVNVRRTEIREVNAEYDRLKRKMDEVMQKNQQMVASNNALGRSWNYMKNRLAFYFTVGASTQFIKNLIEVRSQYEMNERALGILINSAERGTEIFQRLSQMALVSPYTLIELSSAAKQLTAYDIAAKDVVDTTRRLADMASAVGVPMERLTYALGQIKAYGYLNSRDARMFANAGIPLVRELSKYYTELEGKVVSVGDVYDRMKKKAIDFNSVMAVVTKMTDDGGKFFDFQAKMADTLKVRIANLTLAWNNMLNDMGESQQGVLTTGIGALKELFLHWRDLEKLLRNVALGFTAVRVAQFALVLHGKTAVMPYLSGAAKNLGWLTNHLRGVLVAMKSLATSPTLWFTVLASAAMSAVMAVSDAQQALSSFNKSVRDGADSNYKEIEAFFKQYDKLYNSLYERTQSENGETKLKPISINEDEAKKGWDVVKEQIEITTNASEGYISSLMQIENLSERIRRGFALLRDFQEVNAAIKEIGDTIFDVTYDWSAWWNLYQAPKDLAGTVKDYEKIKDEIVSIYGDIQSAREAAAKTSAMDVAVAGETATETAAEAVERYEKALQGLQKQADVTAVSIRKFIESQSFSNSPEKVAEVFSQVTQKYILEKQLDPKAAFDIQLRFEKSRAEAMRQALQERINDEQEALKLAVDKETKFEIETRLQGYRQQQNLFTNFTDEQRVYWGDFTNWIKERHISETREMFRGMTADQIKSLNMQEGKYAEWVMKMVDLYREQHKMSIDEVEARLGKFVHDANQLSIFIPLIIGTEEAKSVYKTLEEADKNADDAYKKMQRLETRIQELREKGAKNVGMATEGEGVSADDVEYTKALKEKAEAQEDYNKALAEGGHSKKEDTAASKAQKQAESELQKALKDEIQIIDKVRSSYKKLTDDSVSHEEAISLSTDGFEKSVAEINKTLSKFGVKKIDLSKFAGITNPQELVNLLQEQLDAIMKSGAVKPVEIKDFEAKIKDLKLDAKSFDQKTFAESLNNSLSKLKDEYELAVALDADPELGNTFAEMMGINPEDLPHTVQEYADEYTKYLNKYLNENGSKLELPHLNLTNDDLRMFEEMVKENKLNANLYEKIAAAVKDVRERTNKDISETIKNWDKLIEKYGEYEAKVNAIRNNAAQDRVTLVNKAGNEDQKSKAVRLLTKLQTTDDPQKKKELEDELKALVTEIAQKDSSLLKIAVAIDNNQLNATATEAFNKFKESGIWEVATGNLSGMTNNAIDGLIKSLETFKKANKGLDTKKVREIDRVIKSLRKQQREGNPFLAIGNAMDEASERAAALKPELDSVTDKIKKLEDKRESGVELSEEEEKELKTLKDRWKELSDAGNLSATEIVGFINQCIGAASQAIAMFNDMVGALSGNKWNEAQEILGDVASTIEKAGQGAAIGAQVGGVWGALIGGVAGGVMGAITAFADNGNKKITASIKESETAVKRLENAYKDLQYAIDEAYGTAKYGAEEAAIANKKLQLAELKRQLELSKSRAGKHRDEDEIESLKGQVIDLEQEIDKATNDIVNDLLDISSVGSAAEEVVSAMIDAFRNGEDYMKSFGDKFSDMIDNMIMKSIVSKVIGQRMEQMFAEIDEMTKSRYSGAQANIDSISTQMKKNESRLAELEKYRLYMETQAIAFSPEDYQQWLREIEEINQDNVKLKKELQEAQGRYADAIAITPEDAGTIRERVDSWKDNVKSEFENWMEAFGISFGDKKESTQLSALQQGISGITETTAGAIEAYMNGVSQQVYLHSDLLMQIRDAVVGFSMDVQLGAMSQILLQLQMNYQIVESIHSMMSGWNNPAGNAMRVELI